MELFERLKAVIADAEADAKKFEAGNNAAGTRLRKFMQETKVLAQDIRAEVTEVKNGRSDSASDNVWLPW